MSRLRNSDGYITLAVLVMVGVLAAIVTSMLMVSRPALGLARIGADEAAADGLLQGGVTAAGFLLVGAKRDIESVDGLTLRFRAGTVRLTAADEGGRINLNLAPPELLAGLYVAVGGTSLDPVSFAGRVSDWRDDDVEPSQGGAEAAEYESEGLGYRPANRPFRSVAELRLLLGLSRSDLNRLEPLLTVHSGQATIDPMSASATVLRAIPNIQRTEVESLIGARRNNVTREQISALIARHAQYFSAAASGAFRVTNAGPLEERLHRRRGGRDRHPAGRRRPGRLSRRRLVAPAGAGAVAMSDRSPLGSMSWRR